MGARLSVIGIIPARYQSLRLPGKPLVDLAGKPMIQRVWEGACQADLPDKILVATDDERILDACRSFGAEAVMTDPALPSGTDRIAAALAVLPERYDIVLNIQGDEPLLRGRVVDALIMALQDSTADVATPVQRIRKPGELLNPAVVKVAIGSGMRALYFSRSAIPYRRDESTGEEWNSAGVYWKHIGLYAYRSQSLARFISLPVSPLEQTEKLEQLRLLEDGALFRCVPIEDELLAVDTPEDAERLRAMLMQG